MTAHTASPNRGRSAPATCPSNGSPKIVCNTLGFLECIRVPLPAARIRAQQEEESALELDITSPHAYLSPGADPARYRQMFPPSGRRPSMRRRCLTLRYNSRALQAPTPCVSNRSRLQQRLFRTAYDQQYRLFGPCHFFRRTGLRDLPRMGPQPFRSRLYGRFRLRTAASCGNGVPPERTERRPLGRLPCPHRGPPGSARTPCSASACSTRSAKRP